MHPHLLFANDLYEAGVYLDANIFIVDSFICDRVIELIKKHYNRPCYFIWSHVILKQPYVFYLYFTITM